MTDREIARRRLHSQSLDSPAGDAETAVRSMLAIQAENPSQSAWAVAARTASPRRDDLAEALTDGRVLRTHVLRSTWHYIHADDARWLLELTAPRVLPIFDQQLRPSADRLVELTDGVQAVLAETAGLTRVELATALADRGSALPSQQLTMLLGRLELHGLICSGAPRDGEHTYALMAARVPNAPSLDRDEALARLALRYLTSHGPATARDLAYWATLTVTDARRGIASVADGLGSFEHEGRTFWHAPDDVPASDPPGAHLLQILDEMYRGYQDSRWVLDADGVVPRDRESAIGMALCDAQLAASMRRSVDKTSVLFSLHPYRTLTAKEHAWIQDAAARYAGYLGLEPRVEIIQAS